MQRKRFLLALGTAICCLATGCSGSGGTQENTAEETVENSEESVEEEQEEEAPETAEEEEEEFSFEETTVMDTENCLVKVTSVGIEKDEYTEEENFVLKVNMENRSAEKTFRLQTSDVSVNGLLVSEYFFADEVLPEKKTNENMEIGLAELEEAGVDKITDVEIVFTVVDQDTYDTVEYQVAHVYPYGEENAVSYTRESQDTDVIFVDNEYLRGTVTGYGAQDKETYSTMTGLGTDVYIIELFLENTSDTDLRYDFDNLSMNSYMLEPFSYFIATERIPAGKCCYYPLVWEKATLDENGITEPEELGFTYQVISYDPLNIGNVSSQQVLFEETLSFGV